VPWLLPADASQSAYLDDETIQAYYEMQFAPFISGPALESPLQYPHPTVRSRDNVLVEDFASLRRSREGNSTTLPDLYGSVMQLVSSPQLTEEFYRCMLDISRPYVTEAATVLDVGCGLGRITAEIARLGADHVLGIDLSPRMIEEAAQLVGSQGVRTIKLSLAARRTVDAQVALDWKDDNYDFMVADALDMPLKSGAFDFVMCLNVIDRVPDPRRLIDEIGRVLRTGGYLLISDPYHWDDRYTKRGQWVPNMSVLFRSSTWQRIREIDGVPFVLRASGNRRIVLYMNHCLIYRRVKTTP
jgi:SAM-dependent methyltransferase